MKRKFVYALMSILLTFSAWPSRLEVQAAARANDYTQIEAGSNFTAALSSDGTLSIWGTLEGMNGKDYVPVFGKAKEWALVSAGLYFITAIKKDGTMWSWGFNDVGQVGNGTTKNVEKPTRIGANKKWKTVSSNYAHSAAIARDGTLWAWGFNPTGELGTGDRRNRSKPVQIGRDKDWDRVIAGEFFTIGIKKDGSTYAWGWGGLGTIGNGKTTQYQTTPAKIGKESWKSLSSGSTHTLALKSDGSLWAWGYNQYGQIGIGTNKNVLKPIRIGKESDWAAISANDFNSFALKKDGTLWAWGEQYDNKPRQIGLDRDWSMIAKHAAGAKHVMVKKKDGSLWGWGSNGSGQILMGQSSEVSFDMFGIPMEVSQTKPVDRAASEMALARQHELIQDDDLRFYKSDVTRQLAARLLVKLYDSLSWDTITERKDRPYDDLYSRDPIIAYQTGFIEPFSKDKFGIYEPMTRQDFLTGVYRVLKASGLKLDPLPQQWTQPYADVSEVSAKAKEALQYLDQAGLLKDEPDRIRPSEAVSREEAYAYVWRAYEKYLANTPYSAAVKYLFYDRGYRTLAGKSDIGEHYFVYDHDKLLAYWDYFLPQEDGGTYARDESLPTSIKVNYMPGKDEFKLDLIAAIIGKERGYALPSLKQALLEKFDELRIDELPYGKNTGEQYITVDGKQLLIILFNESKTKERQLEVDY
ncbi:S-layer homology domain-containing protein [Cohnella sp. CFH 77786]|uniref:RCC1 domain-containing protein n=1 Tax=Cohnella sp. CFH 77786 TaxID=2662265 RepID=UPI001C609977|nr:RCC1 domain-containing protein [Cohnella sp. CFH 77786]